MVGGAGGFMMTENCKDPLARVALTDEMSDRELPIWLRACERAYILDLIEAACKRIQGGKDGVA